MLFRSQAFAYWSNAGAIHAPLLLLALLTVLAGRGRPFWLVVLAGAPTAIGVGKWGAGESYFLGLLVAVCVLAGTLWSSMTLAPWAIP
mgnify:CR=1 FL=1